MTATSSASLDVLKNNALVNTAAYSSLQELSDSIGPRVTGSPEAAKAAQWAAGKMASIGLTNVHLESWQLRRGWSRKASHVEMTSPIRLPLNLAAYGWTGSTPAKGIEAPLALVNRDDLPGALSQAPSWAGKIVFVAAGGPTAVNGLRVASQLPSLVSAAEGAHALGVINRDLRPGTMLTHTGPVEAANVVGEIRGTEHPEQVVVLGAHLDSWDLGTGAIDDGADTATVALTAFWIADHPERLGAAWPRDRTAQQLTEDGQRTILQLFKLWPFDQ
jgi:carboxypeptidase Q